MLVQGSGLGSWRHLQLILSGFTGETRFGLGRRKRWGMGYRAAKATKKQRLPPSKLSLLLGMLGGPTLPQGDEGLTVQAEGSRAMRYGLGTHREMRAQEDWVEVPRGLLGPAQRQGQNLSHWVLSGSEDLETRVHLPGSRFPCHISPGMALGPPSCSVGPVGYIKLSISAGQIPAEVREQHFTPSSMSLTTGVTQDFFSPYCRIFQISVSFNNELSLYLILQWIQEMRAPNDLHKPFILFWAGKMTCLWSPSYSDPSCAWTTPE